MPFRTGHLTGLIGPYAGRRIVANQVCANAGGILLRGQLLKFAPALWIPAAGLVAVMLAYLVASGGTTTAYMIFGPIAAVAVIAWTVKHPKAAPLIVLAAAVYDRHIYYDYETLQLSTLVVVLALTAPVFLVSWVRSHSLPRYFKTSTTLLSLGLVLANAASPHGDLAGIGTVRWLLVLNMVAGTVALCMKHEGLTRRLAWWFLAGGAVASVLGMMQRAGIYALVGPPYAQGVYNSTFGYYSNFANFVAVASVVGVGLVLNAHREQQRGKWWAVLLTLLCLYSVAASLSRGALICVGVGVAVIILRQITRLGRFVATLFGLGLLGAGAWMITPEEYTSEFVQRFLVAPNGDFLRQQMQNAGVRLLEENPLGIGFNNFSTFVSSGLVFGEKALSHSHNTFVQMGLDAGWIGGLAFIILTVGSVFAAFRARGDAIRLGAGAAVAGFLAQTTQDFFFFEPASMAIFGLALAMSAARTSPRKPDEETGSTIPETRAAAKRALASRPS